MLEVIYRVYEIPTQEDDIKNKIKKEQQEKLNYIKTSITPNQIKCANCEKWIDITKDHYQFGTSLNHDFIYCSDRCADWHFSRLMF